MAPVREGNPPKELLLTILEYDRNTGLFCWLWRPDASSQWNGRYAGKIAGTRNKKTGQISITVTWEGFEYRILAHRLAWFFEHGVWPDVILDHKDRNPSNNSIKNLREANFSDNGGNSSFKPNLSGFNGVHIFDGRFAVHVRKNRKQYHIGYYPDAITAARAYDTAAVSAFGQFAHTNFPGAVGDLKLVRKFLTDEVV